MESVDLDIRDWVATITLNRPAKHNAMTPEMSAQLVSAIQHCNDNPAVRVVIVTGAGERAFCVGSDVKELDRYPDPWAFRNRTDYVDALRALRKPLIAAVNGMAYGGGLEMTLAADIRVASTAAQFAAPEIKLGWVGGGGVAHALSHSIGPSHAAIMIMTGEPITAAQAAEWGLVSTLLAPDALLAHATALARTIAARAPIAAETAKMNLRAAVNMTRDMAFAYERELQTICFATHDAAEGRAAFKEKRAPKFEGR
ncbi:enoyl-CoA hydratase/isomerase family protein [Pararobbsia silviterrae]|uniref:Enoyl-CoA hydratase/isomerase family protein n=1 Tax=Pararobbsia silviterrae TaxID=1792498 RepID=A0A494XF14_9BURK|nr:enoyl-CoA hydratase/isomerase family protein [Pararobbsia silviterrae]RKP47066.1 enoyl-CoA hydratase/isomerase family protein [Pararobbsia silviterrae]